ncbi:capsule assembly Wzi family protein [Pedobacter panaciterrae]
MNSLHLKKTIALFSVFIIGFSFIALKSNAQVVYENPTNPVYKYLSRQAQKGNIEFNDLIQPVSRKQIASLLTSLQDSSAKLTTTEQKELAFYLQEFSEFSTNVKDTTTFFKKDQAGRWRFLSVTKDDFLLRGDPALTFETFQGKNKSVARVGTGLTFWGHAGKHISFQFYFQDITDRGKGIDSTRIFTPETGIIRTANINPNAKTVNYSDFRGNITYAWENGAISFGKDQMLWGYGQGGRLVLSDKSPAYPNIRIDYQPLKWLRFNYIHAWLNSALVDSARSYDKGNPHFGNNREIYIPKFLASHTLSFIPVKGLDLSVGESVVYSDNLDVGYLIPVMFFKAYDQYQSRYKLSTGANSQFFFSVSSRNHLPKTHLYGSLFIDEIRTGAIFNASKSRNQIGYSIGASVTDVLVPYLTLGGEYSRINPYAYNNLIPAQTYTNQSYLMGDWIGQNADRVTAWVNYTPIPRMVASFQFTAIRKGQEGNLYDQYFAEPQPKFLSEGPVETQKQYLLEVNYQLLNKLYVKTSFMHQDGVIRPALQTSAVPNEFKFGVSYGF